MTGREYLASLSNEELAELVDDDLIIKKACLLSGSFNKCDNRCIKCIIDYLESDME